MSTDDLSANKELARNISAADETAAMTSTVDESEAKPLTPKAVGIIPAASKSDPLVGTPLLMLGSFVTLSMLYSGRRLQAQITRRGLDASVEEST
jgi:hypothetical protein